LKSTPLARGKEVVEMAALGPVRVLYAAEATASGGRDGHAKTSDGRLDVALDGASELGGSGGPGTNPEQLFASGFAACFHNALEGGVARRAKVSVKRLLGHLARGFRADRRGTLRPNSRAAGPHPRRGADRLADHRVHVSVGFATGKCPVDLFG
jgi:hypothetical protein